MSRRAVSDGKSKQTPAAGNAGQAASFGSAGRAAPFGRAGRAVPLRRARRAAFKSQMTRRFVLRYVFSLAIYAILLLGLLIVIDNITYISTEGILLIVLFGVVGWTFYSMRLLSRPIRYLDELLGASAQLLEETEKPVELSRAMKSAENELNSVRQRVLEASAARENADRQKNDMLMYLAHDLKTPLTSILGYLTLLRDEPDLDAAIRARYTGVALEKAERLEELIEEFFDVSRLSLTEMKLTREERSLTRMLQQVAFEFEPVLAEHSIGIETHLEEGVVISCDADKLERVFDNLLRNAASYSTPGTRVVIRMRRAYPGELEEARAGGSGEISAGTEKYAHKAGAAQRSGVVVTVENEGETIPPGKLLHIFEQFYRADSARGSRGGGAGLGLAIARQIVELHGGIIRADSRDRITTFTVCLPDGM